MSSYYEVDMLCFPRLLVELEAYGLLEPRGPIDITSKTAVFRELVGDKVARC